MWPQSYRKLSWLQIKSPHLPFILILQCLKSLLPKKAQGKNSETQLKSHQQKHIECGTLTASSFGISNSSAGIPSPPLALFLVMLPKAHLSMHSRLSGCRWVITPSWLSGSWRSFCILVPLLTCFRGTSWNLEEGWCSCAFLVKVKPPASFHILPYI